MPSESCSINPARLIYALLFLLLLGVSLFSGSAGYETGENFRDISELYAMVLAVYAVLTVISTMAGLQSGASFYSMSDVNFLFCAPFSNKRILIYGLVRQLGTTAIMGLLLIFQYGWISNLYGITPFDMIAIILGYVVVVFALNSLPWEFIRYQAVMIRKRVIRAVIYALCIVAVVYVFVPAFQAEEKLNAIVRQANHPALYFCRLPGG